MAQLRFALVSTCKNEIESVTSWIKDISQQSRQPDEISLVDSCSTDGTWEVLCEWAESDPRVRLSRMECTPAEGRNRAISECNSEIVVSTDMGCVLDRDWFRTMSQPFRVAPSLSVVAGNYACDLESIDTAAAWAAYYLDCADLPQKNAGFLPSNRSIAFRKDTWDRVGRYPEDLTFAGDDTVFSLILTNSHLNIHFARDALVYWGRPSSWRDYAQQSYRYGLGNGEAGISVPWFARPTNHRVVCTLSVLSVLTSCRPHLLKKAARAFLDGHISAAVLIVPLHLATTLSYNRGYLKGLLMGANKCRATRQRLASLDLLAGQADHN